MILLDTNVISAMIRTPPDGQVLAWVDRHKRVDVWTTSITVMEVETGLGRMASGAKHRALLQGWHDLCEIGLGGRVAAFDIEAAHQAAQLANERERTGFVIDVRDTQIAGIALAHQATLATRNIRHFQDLETPVINPWTSAP